MNTESAQTIPPADPDLARLYHLALLSKLGELEQAIGVLEALANTYRQQLALIIEELKVTPACATSR